VNVVPWFTVSTNPHTHTTKRKKKKRMKLSFQVATRTARQMKTRTSISILHGRVHPPLAATTPRTPRDWKPEEMGGPQQPGGPATSAAAAAPPESLPLLLMCHATGFCKETWLPVVEELAKLTRAPLRWIAMDFSGHGDSRPLPCDPPEWGEVFAGDIMATLEEFRDEASVVVGVGHSMGGAALLHSSLQQQGKASPFASLALFEPIVIDPAHGDPSKIDEAMASQALRRRSEWANASEADAYFRSRKAFSGFAGDSMEALVSSAVRDAGDGIRVELKCSPESEASVYRGRGAGGGALWGSLGSITTPTHVFGGGMSPPPLDAAHFQRLSSKIPSSTFTQGDHVGHFSVMQDPNWVAKAIASSSAHVIPNCFNGVSMTGLQREVIQRAKL